MCAECSLRVTRGPRLISQACSCTVASPSCCWSLRSSSTPRRVPFSRRRSATGWLTRARRPELSFRNLPGALAAHGFGSVAPACKVFACLRALLEPEQLHGFLARTVERLPEVEEEVALWQQHWGRNVHHHCSPLPWLQGLGIVAKCSESADSIKAGRLGNNYVVVPLNGRVRSKLDGLLSMQDVLRGLQCAPRGSWSASCTRTARTLQVVGIHWQRGDPYAF